MGQGDRTLFQVLTSSDLEYLRGGREAFAYGAGQGVEDKSQNKSFSSVETSRFRARNHARSHNRQWSAAK